MRFYVSSASLWHHNNSLPKVFWPLFKTTARERKLDCCSEVYNCEAVLLYFFKKTLHEFIICCMTPIKWNLKIARHSIFKHTFSRNASPALALDASASQLLSLPRPLDVIDCLCCHFQYTIVCVCNHGGPPIITIPFAIYLMETRKQ